MDDIDSYYTDRPAYPRPPPPGNRTYPPPPHMMRMGPPPYGRPPMGPMGPMGPNRMGPPPPRAASPGPRMPPPRTASPGPRMGPGMGMGPMGRPAGPPQMGQPMDGYGRPPMDRPMGPALNNGQRMGPPGPPPAASLPRRPESPFTNNVQSPNMIPAPLSFRRSPPPQQLEPPQRRASPPMKSPAMAPLDSIGRVRSPSPNPNGFVQPLDTIGAPRPPRSASARPAGPQRTGSPNLLPPSWEGRSRSHSADDYGRDDTVSGFAPLSPPNSEMLPSAAYRMSEDAVSPTNPQTGFLPATTYQSLSQQLQQSPSMDAAPPKKHGSGDIVLGADFFEEITVGPYQDLDHPPPLPRKNSIKPSVASQILAPRRFPSPAPPHHPEVPETPEDDSPLPNDRGLRSMWLGDIQAGPYAQEDAPPMPLFPNRSLSRSPPIDTPDMSEPPSDSEDNFGSTSLPPLFAGLRIQTGDDQHQTLSQSTYNPYSMNSAGSSYNPGTPDNRDSYATDICDTDIRVEESSPLGEEDDVPARVPRKHIPSMCEYMSMDQLEDMWGREDQLGSGFGGGYFSMDGMPTCTEPGQTRSNGTPF